MVKNKSSNTSKSSKILIYLFKTFEFILFTAVIITLFFFWYKPEIITKQINTSSRISDDQENLKNKIVILSRNIDTLSNALLNEREKFDLLQKNVDHFNASKVNASEILAINNQLRNLENQTQKLAKTSNNGALLLTSAMLIKDTILHGQTCEMEAEALKILADNISSISKDVDFIYSHCSINFISDKSLIDSFNKIYTEETKPVIEKDWKKRITSKVNEYVKISTINDKNSAQVYDKTEFLEKIRSFVNNNDFNSAIKEIENQKEILENQNIKFWYQQTKNQLTFYKSLSNIIANALQIMKVENARNDSDENPTDME